MVSKKKNTKTPQKKPAKKSPSTKLSIKSANAKKKSSKSKRKNSNFNLLRPLFFFLIAISILCFFLWTALLDFQVREKFEGKRWSVPAKVYSRPLELFVGLEIHPSDLLAELKRLQYKESNLSSLQDPGSFSMKIIDANSANFSIKTRGFNFSDGEQSSINLRLDIKNKYIVASSHAVARLEPQLIGGIYPSHHEDRVLIQLEQTPPFLIETLVLVEDREFFNHRGVSPKGIIRAAAINLFSGRVKQGGSTLTQQLVKNFYLSNERTILRKINEAMMALLLESHYSKNEILEAYLNEVSLGQIGKVSIHGFGLASQHYFGTNVENLDLHQVALLVALVKGPSFYEPRRNPERALERRNLVLSLMAENNFISEQDALRYQKKDLGLTETSTLKHKQYPAFLSLVKHQLTVDYSTDDLQSEGLRIFTSFDPILQSKAEQSVSDTVGSLRKASSPNLQGAMLVIAPQTAEVLALVGGADVRSAGFNRVLDAKRAIGSLVKPAVYMTALKQGKYQWSSLVDDNFIYVDKQGSVEMNVDATQLSKQDELWSPRNFDNKVHSIVENKTDILYGKVSLIEAMSNSYNQATVHLGLEVGVSNVINTLKTLGIHDEINAYPSLLLGAIELSPFDVTQMYQTIASGGFNTPIKAIREVQDAQGRLLSHYPFTIEQVIDNDVAYLIHAGLQEVVKSGTARSLNQYLPREFALAGKTGTTNDLRDSWFVGYGGNMLATVWVGNDDNSVTPYTGSSAALKVWTHFAINFPLQAGRTQAPEGINWYWIDPRTQTLSDESCATAVYVAMKESMAPKSYSDCGKGPVKGFKRLFGL